MNINSASEFISQALIIRTALEALSVVTSIMLFVSLVAVAVYLIGIWNLCRAEYRRSK